jgi:STE24 endopeptidase
MTPNKYQRYYFWLLLASIVIILLSPVPYWLTGIGQSAHELSADIGHQPDGALVSSPKALAHHRLTLPMQIERMIIYPLLLLAFQLSGGAVALRNRLAQKIASLRSAWQRKRRWQPPAWFVRLQAWPARLVPNSWRQRLDRQELAVILLFILSFNLAIFLIYLPFNFYRGFTLAHQFGLSTQTAAGWINDWLKNVLIALATNGLLWTGFYALLKLFPRRWPIPGGALLLVFSIIVVLLTPIVITPLFYKVHSLADPVLRDRILTLAERAGMPVKNVFVIDASAKTTEVNAYVTGFGDARRIVLFDTLIAGYTPDQVEAVLAHELGHWHYRHVLLGVLGMGAVGWLGLFGLRWLLNRSWRPLGLHGPADVAGLPYILAVVFLVSTLSLPVQNSISRYAEAQADRFALQTSQKPAVFITLFEQLAVQNLSLVNPPPWEKFIFYTHPPIVERIKMAENFMATQLSSISSESSF